MKVIILKSSYLSYIVGGHNFFMSLPTSIRILGDTYMLLAVTKKMRFSAYLQMLITLTKRNFACPSEKNRSVIYSAKQ